MAKYKPRFFKPEGWQFKNSWLEGMEWPVTGSTGKTYRVAHTPQGFTCDCQGFGFHGYCKHSKGVVRKIERAIENPYREQGHYEIG